MTEESDFEKYRPKVTEVTSVDAARSWAEGGEILSLNGRSAGLDGFMLVLADDSETHGPFVMGQVCARELCAMLLAEGYGPKT